MGQELAVRRTQITFRTPVDPVTDRLRSGWLLEFKSDQTRTAYSKDLDNLTGFLQQRGVDLLDADRAHLAAWGEAMRQGIIGRRPASEASIGRRYSSVSSFYTYCVQEGALKANPAKDLRRPKLSVDQDGTAWLTVDQADRFLAASREHSVQAHAIAALMLTTAARVGEVTGASVTDLGHTGGHRVLTVVRKGDRRQHLPLAPWVGQAIDEHLNGRADGPLFTNRNGRRMDHPTAWRLVRTIARKAGLENAEQLHPHSLRHTAITAALEKGEGLREVQALAGHVDPRTTERYDRMRARLDTSPAYALAATFAPRGD